MGNKPMVNVEVDPEMMKLLERFQDFNIGIQNPRSLASLK
jgi:hypothetical protein